MAQLNLKILHENNSTTTFPYVLDATSNEILYIIATDIISMQSIKAKEIYKLEQSILYENE
jgi:hypothetical protein